VEKYMKTYRKSALFRHGRIERKNRDFSKALKCDFPEGFSIQRELATAI